MGVSAMRSQPVAPANRGSAPLDQSRRRYSTVKTPTETISMWWHRPVVLDGEGRARVVAFRGSGDVVAAARSDGFVEIPPGASGAGPFPFYAWGACR